MLGFVSFSCNRSIKTTTSTFRDPTPLQVVSPKTTMEFIEQEAKELKENGWEAIPGYGSMESILYSLNTKNTAVDSSNNLKYIVEVGFGTSSSEILSVQTARANALRKIACAISTTLTTTQDSIQITNCYEGAIDSKEIGVLVRSINEGNIEAWVSLYAEHPR